MFASEDLFKPNQGTTEVARPSSRGGNGLFSLGNNNRPAQTTTTKVAELTAPITMEEPANNTNKVNIDEYLYATDDKPYEPQPESDAYQARPGTRGRDMSLPREPDRINTGNDRPPSAPRPPSASMNTRQKLMEQQKKNLLEKQKQNFADMVKSDVNEESKTGPPTLNGFRQPEIPNFNPGTALGTSNANNTTMSQSNNPSMAPKVTSTAPLMGSVLNFPTFNIFTNNIPESNPVKFTKNDDAPAPPPPEPEPAPQAQVLKVPMSESKFVEEEKKQDAPSQLEKVPPITNQTYAPARPQSGKPVQKEPTAMANGNSMGDIKNIDPAAENKNKKKTDAQAAADKEEDDDVDEENEDGENIPVFPSDSDIPDMKNFVLRPAPKNCVVQCTIKREKGGMARFFPKYSLYFSEGLRFIMTGKKRPNNKTSNYGISVAKGEVEKGTESFIGKLRSNFVGTEFVMYDHGENPADTKDMSKIRREYGAILYEQNFLGERGPRKMKILIPELTPEGDDFINYKPLNDAESMIGRFKEGKRTGMRYLFNKPPKWNDEVSAFVLNFHGRVDKPSVKNFQLIDTFNEDYVYMQFGRVGDDMFNMDIRWPMSIMQGFAIALSSFDFKLACE